ncbi:MAG TPA: TIR domain-containing protein [Steroidobacteraceae bacterium]|nr:TIR domain-containing protein [Steroidobacteraceae bacterium]
MATAKSKSAKSGASVEGTGRTYLSQSDVPAFSLEQALRVPNSISDNFGKGPTKPLRLAQAMNLSPQSSGFRMVCGASVAYGLTDGGYNAAEISLTALGRRIVAPTREGDDLAAKREATLRPRVVRDFLTRYNGSKLPPEAIGRNVLEEIGVPTERTAAVYSLIVESARTVGFLREVKGQSYIDLEGVVLTVPANADPAPADDPVTPPTPSNSAQIVAVPAAESLATPATIPLVRKPNRVFITHGKNQEIVSQLKEMLTFGGFTPIVAIENETISKPVPDKVLDDMRSCDAAVIHVGAELRLLDQEGKEYRTLNQNVLIEIGAAMAFYGRKFILLVEKGVSLPSNLQGLYEVRHEGGKLDYESTMKLLRAFNDFRS